MLIKISAKQLSISCERNELLLHNEATKLHEIQIAKLFL